MNIKQVVVAFLIILLLIYIHFSGVSSWLSFEYLKSQSDALRAYAVAHHAQSALLFVLLYSAAVAASLPAAFVLTIVGGYLFGTLEGAFYSTVSSVIGGLGAFFIVRYVLGHWIQKRYATSLKSFNVSTNQYGSYVLLMMHLMPFVPYSLINIIAGISRISWTTFVWTTFLGVFPITLVYAFAGKELSELNSVHDVFSYNTILALTLIACASLVPFICMKIYQRFY